MKILGQICLLASFVGFGFTAFAYLAARRSADRWLRRVGAITAAASVVSLSVVMGVLAWALLVKDFQFEYVARYSSNLLPWYYSLSALWVGQAGSILLWAWFLGVLGLAFRFWPRRESSEFHDPAFGILMAYACFLVALMVFAADPMAASVDKPHEGAGLSPLLQHPAMLIHPPIVLLAYAIWAVPFALVVAALMVNRLDVQWVRHARPWTLVAWITLGSGILLGANWSYEELGWGGYWAWDPVENGSLIPWLTGTALIHTMMAWQYRQVLKKTAIVLALATFGLCNFATFLTRSGIFSSLHAFSSSPIGWLFLVLLVILSAVGGYYVFARRAGLKPERPIGSVVSCEGFVIISTLTLTLLAVVTIVGTLNSAISSALTGQAMLVGPAFYNNVLIPTGMLLLIGTAMTPLLRWGKAPSASQRKRLLISACIGVAGVVAAVAGGYRHPITLAVMGVGVMALAALASEVLNDAKNQNSGGLPLRALQALRQGRHRYAGFLVHLGFVFLAVGVAGSSLGSQQQQFLMKEGESVEWAGRKIRLSRIHQRDLPDKFVAEAELEISRGGGAPAIVRPAQHFHRLQEQWTTEVAIHATWGGDFYTILHRNADLGEASLTFVDNPLMRWMWFGGWVMGIGIVARLWPDRRKSAATVSMAAAVSASPDGGIQRRAAAAALLIALLNMPSFMA